jgi:hypothetical protein
MLDLIANARVAIDDLIDVMGRATIEAALLMNAARLLVPSSRGRTPTATSSITKLDAKVETAMREQFAPGLEQRWPDAAASLREGLGEMSTINRSGLPSLLRRCLGTTNIIDNGHSAARDRMRRVKSWQTGVVAVRWTAAIRSRPRGTSTSPGTTGCTRPASSGRSRASPVSTRRLASRS